MINPMDLTGKHIIVTGASSGIGKETAQQIAKLGAKASLISRSEDKLKLVKAVLEGTGHNIFPFDLKNISGIEGLIKNIVEKQGPADGLAHCAGVGDMRPLQVTNFDFIHEIMLINFYSFIELTRTISKKRNYNENTSIVVVSSAASKKGDKSKTAYCASKGALDSSIRSIAKELATKRIRVNSVLPGFLKTEMYDLYLENVGKDSFEKNVLSHQYYGMGEPIDAANAIAFLLSDASKFITGTGLIVDGGYLS